jgi:hypothetical protein
MRIWGIAVWGGACGLGGPVFAAGVVMPRFAAPGRVPDETGGRGPSPPADRCRDRGDDAHLAERRQNLLLSSVDKRGLTGVVGASRGRF